MKKYIILILGIITMTVLLLSCPTPEGDGDGPNNTSTPTPTPIVSAITLHDVSNGDGVSTTENLQFSWDSTLTQTGVTYTVFLGESNPPQNRVKTGLTTKSYTHTSALDTDTVYYWKVEAVNAGDILDVASDTFTTNQGITLTSPVIDATTEVGNITLTWSFVDAFDGGDFKVFFDKVNPPLNKIGDVHDITDAGLYKYTANIDFEGTYYWQVKGDDGGLIKASPVRKLETEHGVVLTPNNRASTVELGNMMFAWKSAHLLSEGTFNIYMDTNDPPTKKVGTVTGVDTYTHTDMAELNFGRSYYWQVEAVHSGYTEKSAVQQITTESGLTASSTAIGEIDVGDAITFSWTLVNALKGGSVDIYIGASSDPNNKVGTTTGDSYTYTGTLGFGTSNYWNIIVKKNAFTTRSISQKIDTRASDRNMRGYVTTSRGGPPVVGSTVSLKTLDGTIVFSTATTDAKGYFSLPAYDGEYAVEARKTNRASSRAVVHISSRTPVIAMQQFPVVVASRSVDPPNITITGVSNQETITSSFVLVTAKVAGSNGFESTSSRSPLSVSVGSVGSGTYAYSSPSTTLIHILDQEKLNNGDTFLEYVGYDNNNNQAIHIISVKQNLPKKNFDTTPATGDSTRVRVEVTTVGENKGTYAISQNTGIYVSMTVRIPSSSTEGILVHRGTSSGNTTFIGSSSKTTTGIYGNKVFEYIDYFPTLTEGTLYYYTFQYFSSVSKVTYVSSKSIAVPVPLFPRLTTQLNTPSADHVYASNPNSIVFSWGVTYPTSIFSETDIYKPSLKRTDTLVVREVGTHHSVYRKQFTEKGGAVATSSGTKTHTFDVSAFFKGLSGKSYYWTVSTEILYTIAYSSSTQAFYEVVSKSYPTLSLRYNKGASHGGVRYFTIK